MSKTCSTLCLLTALALVACESVPPSEPSSGTEAQNKPCRTHRPTEISSISFEDFFLLHQSGNLFLIDARHPWFFNQGRIPGAININPDGDISAQIHSLLPKIKKACRQEHPIIVYCNGFGCHDARTVLKAIASQGYDCTKFGGGWKAWKKVDLPVESSSQESTNLTTQPAS